DELIAARRCRNARDFARDELTRRARKARKKAAKLAKLDPRARHKLRIGVKKLRYAADFFARLFDGRKARKRLRRFEGQLEALQGTLGALNDIAVHQQIAGKVAGGRGRRRQRAFAVGIVSGREQCRVAPLRDAAVRAADQFREARAFWN